MQDSERAAARQKFLEDAGGAGAQVLPLTPDASFRHYFRVSGAGTILVDAPPPRENLRAFVEVARHLAALGLHPPRVHACDLQSGFALLDDFGDDTFTRLLAAGADERTLYRLAVDVLCALQTHRDALDIDLPLYDDTMLVDEVLLLVDWYYPAVRGQAVPGEVREEFVALWHDILAALPPIAPTLVLRDFHVDNLMRVAAVDGSVQCGLLDFQDAVIGSPAYDLMSLLEDARRDVPRALVEEIVRRYHRAVRTTDTQAFDLHFHVLAAQRHCKVMGIFSRLCRRDGKSTYLDHIPRVVVLLEQNLTQPSLRPLRLWLDIHLPMRHEIQVTPG
ncbi:MAG: phosphotransferase [Gammaproteobacteria bacterium]|nr:phosphotransferase [Gammaproteobacteria bacterium]